MRNVKKTGFIFLLFLYIGIWNASSQTNTYSIKTVVIDAGHGGKDPGAVGKNSYEKNITLAIALKTGAYIQKNIPGVKVVYTRSTDVFVELYRRAEIANEINADLFISIHVNSSTNVDASGTDTWIMGLHKSKANLEVAKRENKVIMVEDNYSTKYQGMSADSTEAIIIHTMMQSANLEHSALLGALVESQFKNNLGRKDRGVHSAPFMVLWRTSMPSILIETGFLSNLEEEKFLSSEQGQDLMASAIYRAFKEYKTNIETKSNVGITNTATQKTVNEEKITPKVEQPKIENTPKPIVENKPIPIKDTIKPEIIPITKPIVENKPTITNDTITKNIATPAKIETAQPTKQTNINQPAENKTNTTTVKQSISPSIIYSIQLASSKNKIEPTPSNFKGIQDVHTISEDGWNKYYVGNASTFKEISVYFQQIKKTFPEAFIVARKDGKKIPIQEAKSITQ